MGLRRALSRCWALACLASGWQRVPRPFHRATPLRAAFHAEGDLSGAFQLSGVWKLERESDDAVEQVPIQPTNPSWSGDRWSDVVRELARKQRQQELLQLDAAGGWRSPPGSPIELRGKWSMDGNAEVTLARFGRHGNHVTDCVEINQCVGCTRQFFTKSFLGDDAAVLARSRGEEPAPPRHRAGVASMAWRTMRRFRTNAP